MDRIDVIRDLTLILMDLTSWKERGCNVWRAWKGYDFDAIDELRELGMVSGTNRAESVNITDEGRKRARELRNAYGIEINPEPEAQRFFRLFVEFDFEELECHRTLLVPEHTTFEDFHTMLQAMFNWLNCHLFDFSANVDGEDYKISWPSYETGGDPALDWYLPDDDKDRPTWKDSAKTYLDDVFPATKEVVYSYDYGDGWELSVTMLNHGEKIRSHHPICTDGGGDAPPEDVGGEGGFACFLDCIEDPGHPEYESKRAWGDSQGFEYYSKTAANMRLRHWEDWRRREESPKPAASIISVIPPSSAPEGSPDSPVARDASHVLPFDHPNFDLLKDGCVTFDADTMDFAEYDEVQRLRNEMFLDAFRDNLEAAGLSNKTVDTHVLNIDLFLNAYLLNYEGEPMENGMYSIGWFLGDWFFRKAMWVSKSELKSCGTSIKKFYRCMASEEYVDKNVSKYIDETIKESMPDWIASLEQWENGEYESFW